MGREHDAAPPTHIDDTVAREIRFVAREVFLHALAESSISKAFDRHVGFERGVLRVGDDLYDLSSFTRVFVVSIGKAAHTMVESLMERLGPGVGVTGIVCGPTEPVTQVFGFRYYTGGHPVPNGDSVRAADSILRSLQALSARSLVIFMMSGGGSSLVERPIDAEITLPELITTYQALVHSGAPIAEINAVRKHLSAVKGGRMALAASPAHQVSILVSDVPEHALDSLASGPTMPDSSSLEDCYDLVRKHKLLKQFPASVRELFERHVLEETPKKGDLAFERSRWWPVLSNSSAQKSAVERAAMSGFAIEVDNSVDDWDYEAAAEHLLRRLRELRKGVSRACLISGGEVTVKVEGKSGAGGRNSHFAAYSATRIAGQNIAVLSAGTDGIDGNSPAAGAIADGTTLQRAKEKGYDIARVLREFNSHPMFEALGDAIVTGPTGTNVRDLRILLAY
jgi:glycerate 2-kinase